MTATSDDIAALEAAFASGVRRRPWGWCASIVDSLST